MSDQNNAPPQDPLAPFTPGGQQPAAEPFTMLGGTFASKDQAEAAFAQAIREKDTAVTRLQAELEAARRTAPQQPQVTPQRPTFQNEKAIEYLGRDAREFLNHTLKAGWGNPDAEGDAIALIGASITAAQQANAKLQEMELRMAHPEIEWANPQVKAAVEVAAREYGSYKGGIAVLQQAGRLPSRAQYEAQQEAQRQQWLQQAQAQAQYGQHAQYGQQPLSEQQQGNPSFWDNTPPRQAIPPEVRPINSAPPAFGAGMNPPRYDQNAILAKMGDPNTPIDEVRRLNEAYNNLGNPGRRTG